MPQPSISIGPWTAQTYTLALAAGILVSAGIGLYRVRHLRRRGAAVDLLLGGLVGGMIGARAVHVLLNWAYFEYNLDEAIRLDAGGLDWHGAVVGALLGMAAVAWWQGRGRHLMMVAVRQVYRRGVPWNAPTAEHTPTLHAHLLDALTPALPLIALAGWFGCWAASCAYGAEVANLADYPPLVVWEGPDIFGLYAPRFHTQALGILFVLVVLVIALTAFIPGRLQHRRFWLVLALLSAGMFGIGFLRGDYAVRLGGLRSEQWLDLGLLAVAGWRLAKNRNTTQRRRAAKIAKPDDCSLKTVN